MIGLKITAIVVFFSYVAYIWKKYGVQRSISNSYYKLPENRKFLFIGFCWLFAFPVMILGDNALMFGAGTFICFVGAAAAMHRFPTRAVHLTGAIGGMILGPIVQKYAFGEYWTGFPYGGDFTDNKMLIMWLAWAIAMAI